MTASVVSSTFGVPATSWGTLDMDYPRTPFAYLEWTRSEGYARKRIRILTEDVVALIFANIGEPMSGIVNTNFF